MQVEICPSWNTHMHTHLATASLSVRTEAEPDPVFVNTSQSPNWYTEQRDAISISCWANLSLHPCLFIFQQERRHQCRLEESCFKFPKYCRCGDVEHSEHLAIMQFMPDVLWTCFTPVVLLSCVQADFWSINMLKMKGLVWFTNTNSNHYRCFIKGLGTQWPYWCIFHFRQNHQLLLLSL